LSSTATRTAPIPSRADTLANGDKRRGIIDPMANHADLVQRIAERALADGLHVPPPLDATTIQTAEAQLGFNLPPLLAALYQHVGNGGFGPDYQLFTLVADDTTQSAVSAYLTRRANATQWHWPEGVLPILHWGCAMNACVDCRHDDAQVLLYEPDDGWFIDSPSLATWLTHHLDNTGWWNRAEQNEIDNMPRWPEASLRA
jgi:hypothetical protein